MKFDNIYSLEKIAKIIDTKFVGDPNFEVHGMNRRYCFCGSPKILR